MFPENFIVAERIRCGVDASSKKRVLEQMGDLFSGVSPQLTQDLVFDRLLERERLGSTGLGEGVALPHARMREIDQAYGAFLQLEKGVSFDAVDDQPVDLAFGLLVPEAATQEHLQLLAHLATLFGDSGVCARLRRAKDPKSVLKELLSHSPPATGE